MNKFAFFGLLIAVIGVFSACTAEIGSNTDKAPVIDEQPISVEEMPEAKDMPVKEFIMTSYSQMVDGKPAPRFSMESMTVNKGDKVRIKVTNTAGSHDFNLDEFDVHAATPLEEEVVVEFVADQTGEFEYYCNMPGHRANGHKGTLIVLE